MTPREHALEFLLPIVPRSGVRSIARALWHAAATDERVAAKFAAIQDKMGSGRPLIGEEHYKLYERLKHTLPVLDIPTAPEWIRPAFAAAYLRARAIVASGQARGVFNNIEARLDAVLRLVDKIESSFVGEVLAETILAAHADREFARALEEGADEFRALATELYGPEGTDRPTALARISGGGGSCVCCTTVGGQTQCAPCSCWIIVVIIIVIIVAK
jgi:hypothetical protein